MLFSTHHPVNRIGHPENHRLCLHCSPPGTTVKSTFQLFGFAFKSAFKQNRLEKQPYRENLIYIFAQNCYGRCSLLCYLKSFIQRLIWQIHMKTGNSWRTAMLPLSKQLNYTFRHIFLFFAMAARELREVWCWIRSIPRLCYAAVVIFYSNFTLLCMYFEKMSNEPHVFVRLSTMCRKRLSPDTWHM